jgi:ribosomal protein L44E
VTDSLPTARSTLPQKWVFLHVWCKACHHRASADFQAIIDAGQGDRPLKDLKFRCTKCGSRMTDAVMMGTGGTGVQPWRADGADSS